MVEQMPCYGMGFSDRNQTTMGYPIGTGKLPLTSARTHIKGVCLAL